ncbi:Non-catalytic module family EXPN protein [Endogone sp. FLAS-F59071]|nr:Non-catalytic module family EXPN protein [Endogone sp. FLAS-F59071]|eukprot:RUS20349.1 Non-catalytic module family EXPN protein [Endogone sp. FLAS-F59071]
MTRLFKFLLVVFLLAALLQFNAIEARPKKHGSATYYNTLGGTGACGTKLSDSEMIVALQEDIWNKYLGTITNPNDNPVCGKKVNVTARGKSHTFKVMDMCPGCKSNGLDLTPKGFEIFDDLSVGHFPITWCFVP